MADSDGDEEARRAKHAAKMRRQRAEKRRKRDEAWSLANGMGGTVPQSVPVIEPPPSMLLASHVQRTAVFLDRLERDETVPLVDRVRVFVSAIPALSKACEAHEFRTRLEDLERRIAGRPRGIA